MNNLSKISDEPLGWLDIGVVLARNLKWLIILPLLAGGFAHWVDAQLERQYVSTALLTTNTLAPDSLMKSSAVLDRLLKKFAGAGDNIEARRRWLSDKISISKVRSAGTKPGDIVISSLAVSDSDAKTAQEMAKEVISIWLDMSKPKGSLLMGIDDEMAIAAGELAAVETSIKKLESEAADANTAEALVSLLSARRTIKKEILELEARRKGPEADATVISPPTLPQEGTRGVHYAALIAATSVAALIVLICIASALLAHARLDPRSEVKIKDIKGALLFRPR